MQQLLIGVTQVNSPSKSFENVSLVLCSTDLESFGLGSNSQNSSIIYNLTYKSFKRAQYSLLSLGFSFALTIMLLKVIHLFLNHPTSQNHSGLTLKTLVLHFEAVFFGSISLRQWKQVKMRLFLQFKIASNKHHHIRFLHM